MRNPSPFPAVTPRPTRRRSTDKDVTSTALQPRPSLRLAQVVPIDRAARRKLRDDFLQLAHLAEQGTITGAVYSVTGPDGSFSFGALGEAYGNLPLAHYAAAQLVDVLLHPDDPEAN